MINPKKYRARVFKNFIPEGEEPTEIKEGYLNLTGVIYKDGSDIPKLQFSFVVAEPILESCAFTGMGKSVYTPTQYHIIELLGEVEDE